MDYGLRNAGWKTIEPFFKSAFRNPHSTIRIRMRVLSLIAGIIIAAAGGALVYHALFVEPPRADLVNTSTGTIRELPNMLHVIGGAIMLILGAGFAFFAARRKR